MRITDLIIDKLSLGKQLWLVEVLPIYEYKDNRRTDTVIGYRYVVAMPERNLEKITVKIDGKQLIEKPEGYAEVIFNGLEVFIYWVNGDYQVGAKATGIALASTKA